MVRVNHNYSEFDVFYSGILSELRIISFSSSTWIVFNVQLTVSVN